MMMMAMLMDVGDDDDDDRESEGSYFIVEKNVLYSQHHRSETTILSKWKKNLSQHRLFPTRFLTILSKNLVGELKKMGLRGRA